MMCSRKVLKVYVIVDKLLPREPSKLSRHPMLPRTCSMTGCSSKNPAHKKN
ncbi:hypothetical protein PAHAL_6G004100 [Panicum hallii]|uniref:Uncharacterized protein n=1 Tax=Panicum hallii TaxID=206008 RepID=A0A2T8IEN8_9POAL|nr:hypothetical protein PAHAL_6G004100 [Panicum hallii]